MAYNTSKIAKPYACLANSCPNYKALAMQKQQKTLLKTADGVIGQEELYDNTAAFVYYMVDPWRGPAQNAGISYIGWMRWSITYTFSGLHRPGAALESRPVPLPVELTVKDPQSERKVKPEERIEDEQRKPLHPEV